MFFVVSGRYRLTEFGIDILAGEIVGELGLFALDKSRTQTLECIEDGKLKRISYEQVKQLYYRNPQFGFYFIQLTTRRLFENIGRLERELAACKAANAWQRKGGVPLSPARRHCTSRPVFRRVRSERAFSEPRRRNWICE